MAQRVWTLSKQGAGWFSCTNKRNVTTWFHSNDVVQAPDVLKYWGIPQYIINEARELLAY